MKQTIYRGLLILALALGIAWLAPPPIFAQDGSEGPAIRPSPAFGAPIYEARCANCHGPTGAGDGPQATQAGLAIPDLTEPSLARETTPARWFDIISNGVSGKAMPPFGQASSNPLREIDLWNLVFYLYSLSATPARLAMGDALYESGCVECHGMDGSGGGGAEPASDLTDLAAFAGRSQADLYAAIADERVQGHDRALSDVEIWALADFVRTFSYNYVPPSAAVETAVLKPFAGGDGVISGQVINGTAGGPLPTGAVVNLRAFDMDANFLDAITTTVAADGFFRFDGIDTTVPVQFEPLITYRDIPYFGDLEESIVLSQGTPEASFNITVYETTDDDSAVRVERLHIVFDMAPGVAQVAELYILSNDGDRAFVGTLEEGTLPLTVPSGALQFQPGGNPNRYLTLADGIADTIPIPPGQSTAESILVYDLEYNDGLELDRPMPIDTSIVNVFVPGGAGIEVSGDGIRSGGPFQAQGTILDTYLADDLAAGDRLKLRLSGALQVDRAADLPSPHRVPGPDETSGIAIGALALVGAVAVSALYWQGHLDIGRRASAPDRTAALLQHIADLDDEYETGNLNEKRYQTQRAKLKDELTELMRADT